MVWTDASLSVRAAFTVKELVALAQAAGLAGKNNRTAVPLSHALAVEKTVMQERQKTRALLEILRSIAS